MSPRIDAAESGASAALTLGPDEVHVWLVDAAAIVDAELLRRYEALLSDEERARGARYKHAPSRHEHLVARALVRTTLSRYHAAPPADWQFDANRYGRPEIAAPRVEPPLRFNLSHSRGLVVCAVARDREIGIDVEAIDRRNAGPQIARRFFAPAEVAELESCPDAEQATQFFNYWTLKEAYIKARGMGLALPLDQFAFRLRNPASIAIRFTPPLEDDPASWQFSQWSPTPRHRLGLAIRRVGRDLSIVSRWVEPLTDAS